MDSHPFETPQAQLKKQPDTSFGLSTNSSISSSASFISQVPLPYHLPASQDARYNSQPARPRSSQSITYGRGGFGQGYGQSRRAMNFAPIPEHPEQETPTVQYHHGRQVDDVRGPDRGHGQYYQQQGMSEYTGSSYNPYGDRSDDGYDQSSNGSFHSRSGQPTYNQGAIREYNQGPSRGFSQGPSQAYNGGASQGYSRGPSQGYNQGRQGYSQNQWESDYEDQNNNQYGAYQQDFGQNDRGSFSSSNFNRFDGGGASHYDGRAGGRGSQPIYQVFRDDTGLQRRRSAGPAQGYSNPRLNNYNGGRGQRHHSFGQERQPATWITYDTRSTDFDSPDHGSMIASGANTPRAGFAPPLSAPTPRTARELGQATPKLLEDTAMRSQREQAALGPPPPFSLATIAEDPAQAPRGRSSTQDPFSAAPVQVQPAMSRSLSTPNHSLVGPSTFGIGPSPHLATLAPGAKKPSVDVAFDGANMPFTETARLHRTEASTGVVRVYNIPFSCTSQEILAFFGRNARTIPDIDEPVTIVMERVTSKTMDAFVEFIDIHEAIYAVNKYEQSRQFGTNGRLGNRFANIEVCGHEVLMQALFPKAKNVKWIGINPKILTHTDEWNSGFKGFVSREELVMLEKHVEHPSRSPFSKDCPQRPFECLISTLNKYPWNCIDVVTIGERDALFHCSLALCKQLMLKIGDGVAVLKIDVRLLRRVKRAVFNCHGFTESQKDDFAYVFGMQTIDAGLPPYAEHWFVFKTISAKRGWAPDVILYYLALLREATTSSALVSLAEQAANSQLTKVASPFGNMTIDYPEDVESMSLAAVGSIEWCAIERLLRKILPSEN